MGEPKFRETKKRECVNKTGPTNFLSPPRIGVFMLSAMIFIHSCQVGQCSVQAEDNSKLQSFELISEDENSGHYTRQWAAHVVGGKAVAEKIARKHGFINTGEIFPDYYHLVHRKVAKRSVEPHPRIHKRLTREPAVRWAKQQKVKGRSKRDFLPLSPLKTHAAMETEEISVKSRVIAGSNIFNFNDPRWPQMWYLNRGEGLDMNVIEAWNEGITGKGVVVTILDDGLEKDHPDIRMNFDPMASFDVNSLDMDPMPTYDLTDSNRHGTRCAGEIAAEANNSICAVGVAFEAGVGGVRMLDGDVTDAVEARSLSYNPNHIDIYSASWGPDDDGKTVDGPGELATRAFVEGVAKGRNGKGSIFVWASGNGGRDHDNCNCDGYTNSIWTLSISSATENGLVPWYSEACSSTLASTYSSGGTGEKQIITIDLHHSCTQSHTGTSASAPLAAGICALALQSNMNLTWRDMQHIVVRTARPANLIAPDWLVNGVGRNVSHSFGYGLMDAGAMVKLARKWKTVSEQHKCEIQAPYTDKNIPAKSKVTLELKVTNCPNVKYLEHVQAKVTLMAGRRGDLQIYLVSPAGTRSVLLAHRRHDVNRSGFTEWPFMTVHSWGESPIGKWMLEIHNEGRYADHKNGRTVLKRWSLIAYGTEEDVNSEDYTKDKGTSNGGTSSSDSFNTPPPNFLKSLPIPSSFNFSASKEKEQNFSAKNVITKTSLTRNKEFGTSHKSDVQSLSSFNSNNSENATVRANQKPSKQRQNKGKNLTKKQKVTDARPDTQSQPNSFETDTRSTNDQESKRLLILRFNAESKRQQQQESNDSKSGTDNVISQRGLQTAKPNMIGPQPTTTFEPPAAASSSSMFKLDYRNRSVHTQNGTNGESVNVERNENVTADFSNHPTSIRKDQKENDEAEATRDMNPNQNVPRNDSDSTKSFRSELAVGSNSVPNGPHQQDGIPADASLSILSTSIISSFNSSSATCAIPFFQGWIAWCLLFLVFMSFEEIKTTCSSYVLLNSFLSHHSKPPPTIVNSGNKKHCIRRLV